MKKELKDVRHKHEVPKNHVITMVCKHVMLIKIKLKENRRMGSERIRKRT